MVNYSNIAILFSAFLFSVTGSLFSQNLPEEITFYVNQMDSRIKDTKRLFSQVLEESSMEISENNSFVVQRVDNNDFEKMELFHGDSIYYIQTGFPGISFRYPIKSNHVYLVQHYTVLTSLVDPSTLPGYKTPPSKPEMLPESKVTTSMSPGWNTGFLYALMGGLLGGCADMLLTSASDSTSDELFSNNLWYWVGGGAGLGFLIGMIGDSTSHKKTIRIQQNIDKNRENNASWQEEYNQVAAYNAELVEAENERRREQNLTENKNRVVVYDLTEGTIDTLWYPQ